MSLSKWEKNRRRNEMASGTTCACGRNPEVAVSPKSLTIVGTRRIRRLICRLLTAGFCLRVV